MSTVPTPHFVLLNSGRAYFPALLRAIEQAQHSVSLETYIFDFNGVGGHVATALCEAAERGVRVPRELLVAESGWAGNSPAR